MTQTLLKIDDKTQIIYTLGNITIENIEAFKERLHQEIAKYDNLVISYTDKSTIATGKKVKADMNKLASQVDEYRKRVKKTFIQPLERFESEMNSIKAIATTGANKIGVLLNEVEEQRKIERQKEVKQMIDELCKGYAIPFNVKWLNATKKDTEIRADIIALVEQEKEKQKVKEGNVKIIQSFAQTYDQQPDGWIAQLEYLPVQEIIENMKASYDAEVEKQRQFEALQQKNANLLKSVENVEIVPKSESELTPAEKYADFLFKEYYAEDVENISERTYTIKATNKQFEQLHEFMQKMAIAYTQVTEEVIADGNEFPW